MNSALLRLTARGATVGTLVSLVGVCLLVLIGRTVLPFCGMATPMSQSVSPGCLSHVPSGGPSPSIVGALLSPQGLLGGALVTGGIGLRFGAVRVQERLGGGRHG
jgi:hypothetical protein